MTEEVQRFRKRRLLQLLIVAAGVMSGTHFMARAANDSSAVFDAGRNLLMSEWRVPFALTMLACFVLFFGWWVHDRIKGSSDSSPKRPGK